MKSKATKGKLFVICAPSGAGKTSLVEALLAESNYPLERVVTYTTKKPRVGDIDGKDYHFLAVEEFQQKIEAGFFIEWSCSYYNWYGSPWQMIAELENGLSRLLIVDWQGAKKIKERMPDAILIIIQASRQALTERLDARQSETQEERATRLEIGCQEQADQKQHAAMIDYVIVNDFFSDALQELKKIVVHALGQVKN